MREKVVRFTMDHGISRSLGLHNESWQLLAPPSHVLSRDKRDLPVRDDEHAGPTKLKTLPSKSLVQPPP